MLQRAALAALLVALAAAIPAAQRATFRASLELVSVAVVVRDTAGRLVTGLRVEDFEIVDDGQVRPIVHFDDGLSADARLALLVDGSGSMVLGAKRERSRLAADFLIAGFANEDAASVFSFDSRVRRLTPFTQDPKTLRSAVASVEPFGTTCLYDAIVGTIHTVRDDVPRTRALVLLTDGLDTASELSASDAATAAAAVDMPVYVMAVGADAAEREYSGSRVAVRAAITLGELANRTGGLAITADSPAELSITTRTILAELRHQYLLAFAPGAEKGWHPLSVRVRRGRVQARSRDGYLVR